MSFQVIALETSEPIRDAEGLVLLFDTGAAAAAHAKSLTETSGKRHQPRPVKDDAWIAREQSRLDDGTYTRVPWDWMYEAEGTENRGTKHHFPHVSSKHPGCIAYTQDATKGAADIQTPMKPGRYLTTFYGSVFSEGTIRQMANEFIARYGALQLRFASTPDDIEQVYLNGPNSCMSHGASSYSSSEHPTRVYGAGDLAIAYLCGTGEDDSEHITARALVWPEKKVYGRIYGDEDKLSDLLEAAGYTEDVHGAFDGAKLLRIKDCSSFVCPYLDNAYMIDDCGQFLKMRCSGEHSAQETNGLIYVGVLCEECNERMDEDDTYTVNDARWCRSCYENGAFYCEHDEHDVTDQGNMVTVHTTRPDYSGGRFRVWRIPTMETWCQDCANRGAFRCEGTDEWYDSSRIDSVTLNDGTVWSQDHYLDNGFCCDGCAECFSCDDAENEGNGIYCDDCVVEVRAENVDSGADAAREELHAIKHRARQGVDHHPDQIEMDYWSLVAA